MSAFELAAQAIKDSGKEPGIQKITNEEKLALYGLYKQATAGDCKDAEPWAVQLEKKAKWTAHTGNKGKSKEDAEGEYVELVKNLLNKYNVAQYIKGF